MVNQDIVNLLESEAARINRPEFIANDPVQFPRRFSRQEDIEIVSLLAAIIAWGKRTMICRDAERLLSLMDHEPFQYMMEEGYEDLPPEMNIHRTLFGRDLSHFMRGLRRIYASYGTLDDFSRAIGAAGSAAPAWKIVEEMQKVITDANGGISSSRCLPLNMKQTALKRVNMALRWLVRDDGIVDMGIWKSVKKSELFIPLDVHVGNTARELGLLDRKANDRKSVELLTSTLREIRPEDPVYFDYALFGIGIGE